MYLYFNTVNIQSPAETFLIRKFTVILKSFLMYYLQTANMQNQGYIVYDMITFICHSERLYNLVRLSITNQNKRKCSNNWNLRHFKGVIWIILVKCIKSNWAVTVAKLNQNTKIPWQLFDKYSFSRSTNESSNYISRSFHFGAVVFEFFSDIVVIIKINWLKHYLTLLCKL